MAKKKDVSANSEILWKDRKHVLWFPFTFTKYEMRDDRLFIEKGLFHTVSDETLLYRITDIKLIRSLGQKLCGTGTIELCTTADHDRHIHLENIKRPKQIKKLISDAVEKDRRDKNVIGQEFFGASAGHMRGPGPGMPPGGERP